MKSMSLNLWYLRKMGFPFRCRKMITRRRQRAGTTLAPTRSCVGGSTRTGSAWTTSIGWAGPMASFAPAVAATTAGGHRICAGCDRRVSVTAGTIFDKTRTPLTVWFDAAWLLVNSKTGVSATQLRREMEPGSVQTAWAMLHRYRTVMVRPGRGRLRGDVEVEVDESFVGGP